MRRITSAIPAIVLVAAALCAGCGADQHARLVLEPDATQGRIEENLKGTADQLVRFDRIDDHRVIPIDDETQIDVWVIKADPAATTTAPSGPKGTVIILHGLGESKASFPYFGAAKVLARKGYDVVLPDLRAHGRSGGKYVTYGAKEKHDVKAVMDALLVDGTVSQPLYACGATLGGATAIQYAAIDPRCKAVLAITPYQDFQAIARHKLLPLGVTGEKLAAAIEKAEELGDFQAADASTTDAAASLTVPLLLVHGMIDLRVPAEQSKAIYQAAAGPKELRLVTPGPEQVAMFTIMEDWLADNMDALIQNPPQTPEAE